ncbi:hypothetical protein NDN08_008101 [Rhodosorus marinus]|uniref:Uncharacterized protein n=1 Tax=Rhodosorus marinus TaxID=101924 RepID=A0AAV8UZG0_9RHOD|nr:hypothetical protein NDN08_008101 [Rhodosorus marinus]
MWTFVAGAAGVTEAPRGAKEAAICKRSDVTLAAKSELRETRRSVAMVNSAPFSGGMVEEMETLCKRSRSLCGDCRKAGECREVSMH